jgi:lipopolysaccharide assembly outer membrane protein LptD (OstA)
VCVNSPVYAFDFSNDKIIDVKDKDVPVEVTADQLEFLKNENKIIGKGNVVVTYDTMRLTADYAEVYSDTKVANAEGHVVLTRENYTMKGTTSSYDFANNSGDFADGQFSNDPYYGNSESLKQVSSDKIEMSNATITTCDNIMGHRQLAHYEVFAKEVTIYPNDKIVAKNVYLKALNKKVFWLPFLHVPLQDGHAPFHIQPGYSSEYGAYVLTSKRYSVNEKLRGKVHVDWRQKRGWGFGNDLEYDSDLLGDGMSKIYMADDKESPNQKSGAPYDNTIENTRYRYSWKHKKNIGRTSIMAEMNKLSDPFLLKDFFEREYRSEVEPETYLNVTHNEDNYGLLVNIEKRINNFYSTTERLPEVRFNYNNQEILDSNVFYKNLSSFNHFNQKSAHGFSEDIDVSRIDTFHEVSYPKNIHHVSVKPFLNWRGNYYSKNNRGEENLTRQVIGGGAEANTKFYRLFDVSTDAFGLNINQLRHILTPSIIYESVRMRSVYPSELFQMDSVDAIDDQDTIKVGFDNRFQTKRFLGESKSTVNVVSYNTYLTYDFKNETEGGSTLLFWENEFEFRPYDWFLARSDVKYDVPRNQFDSADLDLEIRNSGKWHLYLQNKFLKEGSKQLTLEGMYRINDLWGAGGYMRYEFDERGIAEEWEVRASRDLHCWFLDFGFNCRNSDIDSSNKELFFELTLKAFPEYPAKAGNHATISRTRMGQTVAGSNEKIQEDRTYDLIRY